MQQTLMHIKSKFSSGQGICSFLIFIFFSVLTGENHRSTSAYIARRDTFLKMLPPTISPVFINPPSLEALTEKPYRYFPESSLFYFTGLTIPEAVLILVPSGIAIGDSTIYQILILPHYDSFYIKWHGKPWDTLSVLQKTGFRFLFTTADTSIIEKVIETLPGPVLITGRLSWPEWTDPVVRKIVSKIKERENRENGVVVRALLRLVREVKSQEELLAIHQAAKVTCQALREIITMARPGVSEKSLAIRFVQELWERGTDICFSPIIATGANNLILHHTPATDTISPSSLILMDVGAIWNGYCVDMTRTIPASGQFTPQQDTVYRIVYKALQKAINYIKPGIEWKEIHLVAVKTLQEELLRYGIIKQPSQVYPLIPHLTIHSIGIDVHEVPGSAIIKEGEIFAIEPGLYFEPDTTMPPRFWNIGIRIEETVVVTRDGAEIITSCFPSEPDRMLEEIRSLRK